MSASLLFVHGTGARDVSGLLSRIRDGLAALDVDCDRVIAAEWGRAVGPQALDIDAALPVESDGLSAEDILEKTGDLLEEDEIGQAAIDIVSWELLVADPLLELRILAETAPRDKTSLSPGEVSPGALSPGALSPAEQISGRLRGTIPAEGPIAEAGVSVETVREAMEYVAARGHAGQAAVRLGSADHPELVEAVARAVVARVLGACLTLEIPPRICSDAATRDRVVDVVATAVTSHERSFVAGQALKILSPLVTRLAIRRRAALLEPIAGFARDVAFYLRRGAVIREHITRTLGELPGGRPVVLLGHSLGGIAAVDLLAGRTMDPRVKLLVTVGSQAPLLYLMDALDTLTYRAEGISTRPFTPWLNIYDPSDLLSFLAGPVWPGESGIADERVDSGASVFAAHSAYWGNPRVYDLIAERWPGG
ncbi:hypothetical protein [Planobispora longispora]|uniref:hypothetical protein n=1 Tax=Planobispora longispora TaxID=28887 RepID=UPI001941CD72|nr:hypothetical protein [Planobispora longispora]